MYVNEVHLGGINEPQTRACGSLDEGKQCLARCFFAVIRPRKINARVLRVLKHLRGAIRSLAHLVLRQHMPGESFHIPAGFPQPWHGSPARRLHHAGRGLQGGGGSARPGFSRVPPPRLKVRASLRGLRRAVGGMMLHTRWSDFT